MTQHVLTTYIESVTRQWRKSAPPILSTSHCEFYGASSCAHARKTILLVPIHPFTRQIVPLLCKELLSLSSSTSVTSNFSNRHTSPSCHQKIFYMAIVFFFFYFLSFSLHTFRALAREFQNFYLKHSFSAYTCLSNNSLNSAWISTKFVSTLLLCMLYQTNNFQHKANTSMYLRDTFTLHVESFHNSDPL